MGCLCERGEERMCYAGRGFSRGKLSKLKACGGLEGRSSGGLPAVKDF